MTTIKLFDVTIADHSHDDAQALDWANGFVFGECETTEQNINTNGWRNVGDSDDGMITVWHDGCEEYVFEALVLDVVGELQSGNVTADNLAEWTTAALEIDWDSAYEATRVDDESTDESGELGDVLEAMYWYGVDCHGGQFSDEYKLQCAVSTVFTPGAGSTGPEPESSAMDMYRTLCEAAGRGDQPTPPPEWADSFESALALECAGLVCRIEYTDANEYRGTLEADGEVWYWIGLRAPEILAADAPHQGGYDCEAALRCMARTILSFASAEPTDDPNERAPESLQDAIERATCCLMSEDGTDEVDEDPDGHDGTRWNVIDSSEWTTEIRALVAWKLANGMDSSEAANTSEAHGEIEIDGETWRVLDYCEADAAANEYIWDSAWAFKTSFLAAHVPGGSEVAESTESFRADKCEDANTATQALIVAGTGKDHFCADAIKADGRGHFLAGYDHAEQEQEIDGTTYYLYRTN